MEAYRDQRDAARRRTRGRHADARAARAGAGGTAGTRRRGSRRRARNWRPCRTPRSPPLLVVAVALLIPAGALAIYGVMGTPSALRGGEAQQAAAGEQSPHALTREQMEAMVESLAAKLQQNPNDAAGWHMLARSYVAFDRLPEAAQAYDKANTLAPGDPQMLADYADVLAMVNGRKPRRPARPAGAGGAEGRSQAPEGAGARRHGRLQQRRLRQGGRLVEAAARHPAARFGAGQGRAGQHRAGREPAAPPSRRVPPRRRRQRRGGGRRQRRRQRDAGRRGQGAA